MRTRIAPALAFLLAAAPLVAAASAPVGVWSLVDKVTLGPDMQKPTEIRIDGTFMVANQLPDYPLYPGYSEPKAGYMYYSCKGDDLVTCVAEWQDLVLIAGTEDNCRGWGSNQLPDNGSVRTMEPAMTPDGWPIAMGIQPGFSPCEALKMWNGGESESATDTTGDPGTGGDPSGDPSGTGGDPSGDPTGETQNPTADTQDPGTGGGETQNPTGDDPTSGGPAESATTAASGDEATAGETNTPPADDDKGGCACTAQSAPSGVGALALLALLGLVRRRR